MKKTYLMLPLAGLLLCLNSCDLVGSIFKGGLIIGLIIAAIIIGLIAWLFIKAFEQRPLKQDEY